MVSFAVRHVSDTALAGPRILASRRTGAATGRATATRMHFAIATSYQIDAADGSARVTVPVTFPGADYSAIDYTPVWAHHRFLGWFRSGAVPSRSAQQGGVEVRPSDPVVYGLPAVYAHWQLPSQVSFDATTGGGAMPSGWSAPDYYEGQPYGTLPAPTHPTLNFGGWYDGGGNRVTAASLVPSGGASLTARYVAAGYTVELNDQWRLSETAPNPDSAAYDGVYESFSNWNVDGETATMSIRVVGYPEFTIYIRSYAESNYDYCYVESPTGEIAAGGKSQEQIDAEARIAEYRAQGYHVNVEDYGDGSYYVEVYDSDWNWVDDFSYQGSGDPGSTKGKQSTDTSINGYLPVMFTFATPAENIINVHFTKDGSASDGDDRGYLLIPYVQGGGS